MDQQPGDPPEDTHHPTVDVSKSLHTAGHETEDLGFQDVPDSGPVEESVEEHAEAEQAEADEDLAIDVGQFGLPRLPDR